MTQHEWILEYTRSFCKIKQMKSHLRTGNAIAKWKSINIKSIEGQNWVANKATKRYLAQQ